MAWEGVTYLGVAAGALSILLAAIVLASSRSPTNGWLAALLVVEGLLQSSGPLGDVYPGLAVDLLFITAAAFSPPLILAVLASLDTPVVAWLRKPAALPVAFGVGAAVWVLGVFVTLTEPPGVDDEIVHEALVPTIAWTMLIGSLVLSYVFSLAASVSALRRAPQGTAMRARAKAFALAFGTRDAAVGLFLIAILSFEFLDVRDNGMLDYVPAAGTVLYVLLLAYGILRTQLFDIDLKIKVGISRSTVVTLGLVAVLAAAKVAEFYLSKTYGLVAGGIAAGMMLVLAPRLNKLGDKVASAALPRASGSPEYIASRKLEVYRAAVETAWEDGSISVGDRAILDRLREKLEITGAEAFEAETDVARQVREASRAASAGSEPSSAS